MKLDDETIQRVWERARGTGDQDPTHWRKDECGAWINREHFDDGRSEFGWKIADTQAGRAGDPEQLRPFHHANSFDIANGRAQCRVTADRTDAAPGAQLDQPRNRSLQD